MRRISFAFFFVVLTAITSLAQKQPVVEYGKPDELKGITKIFISTGADMTNRQRMLKVFEKEKKKIPDIVILDSPEGAEVVLGFNADRETYLAGVITNTPTNAGDSTTSSPTYRNVYTGAGIVFVPKDENRMRVLMDFSGSARFRWTDWPSEQFAKAFVKAYIKANAETKK